MLLHCGQDWSKGDSVSEADLFQPGPILAVDVNPTTGQRSITLAIAEDEVVTATTLLRSAVRTRFSYLRLPVWRQLLC
jgi:hypothetical protein